MLTLYTVERKRKNVLNFIAGVQYESYMLCSMHYGNTGCRVFKWEYKIRKIFAKNQHTQRKLLNFENWCNRKVSKVLKFDYPNQFSMSKIIRIFLIFWSWNDTNLGAHFLLLTFLMTSIFKSLYH